MAFSCNVANTSSTMRKDTPASLYVACYPATLQLGTQQTWQVCTGITNVCTSICCSSVLECVRRPQEDRTKSTAMQTSADVGNSTSHRRILGITPTSTMLNTRIHAFTHSCVVKHNSTCCFIPTTVVLDTTQNLPEKHVFNKGSRSAAALLLLKTQILHLGWLPQCCKIARHVACRTKDVDYVQVHIKSILHCHTSNIIHVHTLQLLNALHNFTYSVPHHTE